MNHSLSAMQALHYACQAVKLRVVKNLEIAYYVACSFDVQAAIHKSLES